MNRINAEHRRLKAKEKEAEQELLEAHRAAVEAQRLAQSRIAESVARLSRLRAQREMLASKGAKMVQLGLQTLDALEEEERRQVFVEAQAMTDVQASGGSGVVDWSAVFLPDLSLEDLLVPQGQSPVDGTAVVDASSLPSSS